MLDGDFQSLASEQIRRRESSRRRHHWDACGLLLRVP
jgi:hypothetical protein